MDEPVPPGPDTPLVVRLCGAFTLTRSGAGPGPGPRPGSRKERQLLAVLAAAGGRTVRADTLVGALWPRRPPQRPADNVATLVSRLRATFGAEVVLGGRGGYRLAPAPRVRVDVDDARALAERAERAHAAGRARDALPDAQRGLALVTEDALVGEPDADWLAELRRDVADLRRRLRHVVAECAVAVADSATAVVAARAAAAEDPLDDRAHRALMAAHRAAGEPDRALAAFARLRAALATELGADPAPETRRLHAEILGGRGAPVPARPVHPVRRSSGSGLAGRDDEIAAVLAVWRRAAAGTPAVHLVLGEGGIGKTALALAVAEAAGRAGATVLRSRCHAAERSLFLQPVLDALAPELAGHDPSALRAACGSRAPDLVALLPELAGPTSPADPVAWPAELARRRAFDAVRALLRHLAGPRPLLLLLDDLHNAGSATVELVHYLALRGLGAPLMVLATLRPEEGGEAVALLADTPSRTRLGPLDANAVGLLSARAGESGMAEDLWRRTRGHPLFVVESLRALRAGEPGVPATLREAVTSRLNRAGPEVERVLRAAAVLDEALPVDVVAPLVGLGEQETVEILERAVTARLLTPAGTGYEFANDLVQDVVRDTTPESVRAAHHRRAVELLTDRPEALARHAAAIGAWGHAARAWLVAGQRAVGRNAGRDARALLDSAESAAERVGDADLVARVHLVRARAWDILGRTETAGAEHLRALDALTALPTVGPEGPDVPPAAPDDDGAPLPASRLAVAAVALAAQADLDGGRAVVAANQLRFDRARDLGRSALAAARAAADDDALTAALDGLKTAYAYAGDVVSLRPVLDGLEPLARRRGELGLLFWTVFESAIPHVAAADWDRACARLAESLDVDRRTWPGTHEAWCLAHLGWVHRLRGDLDRAAELGARAVAAAADPPHPWWDTAAVAMSATTLLERDALGDRDTALGRLEPALRTARGHGPAAYVLRCAAPLAEATGDPARLAEADALLAEITTPPGGAWLTGGDAYLSVARARLALGDPEEATRVAGRLVRAADRHGWRPWQVAGRIVEARARRRAGDPGGAATAAERARRIALACGMAALADRAAAVSAGPA